MFLAIPASLAMAGLYLLVMVGIFASVAFADKSVVQILEANGLPPGLLPSSVVSYSLSETGKFVVQLQSACTAKFEDKVYYQKQITGDLKFGEIENLSGISAHELFVWVPVTGIRVDVPSTGWIYFEVGFLSKKLSVDLFESAPPCNGIMEEVGIGSLSFSAWLAKALNGELEVSGSRKMLSQ